MPKPLNEGTVKKGGNNSNPQSSKPAISPAPRPVTPPKK